MAVLYKLWVDFWGGLPAEIKVAVYLALSYGLAQVVTQLEVVEIENVWAVIGINIIIVFLKNLKPRYDRYK